MYFALSDIKNTKSSYCNYSSCNISAFKLARVELCFTDTENSCPRALTNTGAIV